MVLVIYIIALVPLHECWEDDNALLQPIPVSIARTVKKNLHVRRTGVDPGC